MAASLETKSPNWHFHTPEDVVGLGDLLSGLVGTVRGTGEWIPAEGDSTWKYAILAELTVPSTGLYKVEASGYLDYGGNTSTAGSYNVGTGILASSSDSTSFTGLQVDGSHRGNFTYPVTSSTKGIGELGLWTLKKGQRLYLYGYMVGSSPQCSFDGEMRVYKVI